MKALNDRVLVKLANMPEKTKGGVYLPTANFQDGQAKINIGKVLKAGDGMTLRNGEVVPVKVKEGDVVAWEQFGGLRFEILGPKIVCIRSEDIGAILEVGEYDDGWFEEFEGGQSKEHLDNIKKFKAEAVEAVLQNSKRKFKCPNNECKVYDQIIEKEIVGPGFSNCEYCGSWLREEGEQRTAVVHVDGGTPRFHR